MGLDQEFKRNNGFHARLLKWSHDPCQPVEGKISWLGLPSRPRMSKGAIFQISVWISSCSWRNQLQDSIEPDKIDYGTASFTFKRRNVPQEALDLLRGW